jgi:hypothetical protein
MHVTPDLDHSLAVRTVRSSPANATGSCEKHTMDDRARTQIEGLAAIWLHWDRGDTASANAAAMQLQGETTNWYNGNLPI